MGQEGSRGYVGHRPPQGPRHTLPCTHLAFTAAVVAGVCRQGCHVWPHWDSLPFPSCLAAWNVLLGLVHIW